MIIREYELFNNMTGEMTNDLISIMQHETHPKGAVLFHRGDPANFFYILSQGKLELTLPGKHRFTRVVAENPGDIVGWSSLVGRKVYSSAVTCVEESSLSKLDKNDLDRLLRSFPVDGRLFYKRLAAVVGERLIMCHKALEEATQDGFA